jgi:hypothetical protein
MTSIVIPASVGSVGYEWFYACTNLTNAIILNGVTAIGAAPFVFCSNLASVTIPSSVTSIGVNAFGYCTNLAGVTLPPTLTNIDLSAFLETGLTSVTVPSRVNGIGSYAFYGCTSMTNATVPTGITSLAPGVFGGCTNLSGVYFQGNTPIVDQLGPFDSAAFDGDTNVTVYYLPGTTGWSNTFDGVPAVLWNPLIQPGDGNFGVQNNQFGFDITGTAGIPIVVEACTNLANPLWTPLTNVTLNAGSFYFSEPIQAGSFGRYYRISSP